MKIVENIVLGGGISGLLCANYLQAQGYNSVLIEKNDYLGGFYSRFIFDDTMYDFAISSLLGYTSTGKGPLNRVLSKSGIDLQNYLVKYDTIDYYIFPDFSFAFTDNPEENHKELGILFPEEKKALDSFFKLIKTFNSFDFLYNPKYKPLIEQLNSISYFDFLKNYFTSSKLISLFLARAFTSRVSAFVMLSYFSQIFYYGAFYFKEGNNQFIDLLTSNYLERGGVIIKNSSLTDVQIENNKIQYITLNNSEQYKSNHYFSSLSPQFFVSKISGKNSPFTLLEYEVLTPAIIMYFETDIIPINFENTARIYFFNTYDVNTIRKRREDKEIIWKDGIKINIAKKKNKYSVRLEVDCMNVYLDKSMKEKIKNDLIQICFSLGFNNIDNYLLKTPDDFEKIGLLYKGGCTWMADYNQPVSTDEIEREIANNYTQIGAWTSMGSGIVPLALASIRAHTKIRNL